MKVQLRRIAHHPDEYAMGQRLSAQCQGVLIKLLSVALLSVVQASIAFAADWRFFDLVPEPKDEGQAYFFDKSSVLRNTPGKIRVWSQIVPLSELNRVWFEDEKKGGPLEKGALKRTINNPIPDYFLYGRGQIQPSDDGQAEKMVEVAMYEEAVNIGDAKPTTKSFFEIDCNTKNMHLLQGIRYSSDGKVTDSLKGKADSYAVPDTPGESLVIMVCSKKAK